MTGWLVLRIWFVGRALERRAWEWFLVRNRVGEVLRAAEKKRKGNDA